MDLLSQLQKFGTVKAGYPPSFVQSAPTTISVSGSVLTNAGLGGLIIRAYTETGHLPSSSASLPDSFAGRQIAAALTSSINYNLASFSGQNSNYSLRISGYIEAPTSSVYTFRVTSDDGVRMYVDDNRIIDSWTYVGGAPSVTIGSCSMITGVFYGFLVEHAATGGSQKLLIEWSTDNVNFTTLTHSNTVSNFSMAYDSSESPGTRTGSLRVSGPSIFESQIAIQSPQKFLCVNNAYVGTLSTLTTDLSGSYAVATWLRHSSSATLQTVISFGGNRHVQINQFNQIVLSPFNGVSVSSTILATGTPNHIVVFLSASSQYSLYVNGALDASYNGTYSTTGIIGGFASNLFAVGGTSNASPSSSLNVNSLVGELSVWKISSLLPTDVLKIYNAGRRYPLVDISSSNLSIQNLYLWYNFGSDSGTNTFNDSSPYLRSISVSPQVVTVPAIIPNSDAFSASPHSGKLHTMNLVSIGTPTPVAPLTLIGTYNSLYNGAQLAVRCADVGIAKHAGISVSTGINGSYTGGNAFVSLDQAGVGGWSLGQDVSDNNKLKIVNSSTFLTSNPYLTIDTTGRVGIGKASPGFNLDVIGNINFTGSLYQGGSQYISSQWTTAGANIYYPSGSVGINNSAPAFNLDVTGTGRFTSTLTTLTLASTFTSAINILTTKLGIGVSGVGQMLDVKGTSVWGQTRMIPQTDSTESAISFYRYSNLTQTSQGDTWILGHRSAGVAAGAFGIGCYGPAGTITAITASSNGYVGIGNTTPAFNLDVVGNINFSGLLYQGGSQYISSQWTTSGANIYYPSGSVGINNSAPTFNLDVTGTGRFTSTLTTLSLASTYTSATNILTTKLGIGVSGVGQMLDVKGTSVWGQTRMIPQTDSAESAISFYRYSNLAQTYPGDTWILGHRSAGAAAGAFGIGCYGPSGTITAITAGSNGYVGIGKTTPAFSLDVLGNINFSGSLYQGGSQYISSQWTTSGANIYYPTGFVGIDNTSPQYTLDVAGDINFTGTFRQNGLPYIGSQWTTTGTNLYYNTGAVGIGNIDPHSLLDVSGTITGTALSVTGNVSYGGVVNNNVFGNLFARFYDESGLFNNITLSSGNPLPSVFLTRPVIDSQLSTINMTNYVPGTLSSKYSLRMTGFLQPPATGTYLFRVTGQEGYALYIAGQRLAYDWTYGGSITQAVGTLTMYAGMWSPVFIESVCASAGQKLLVEFSSNAGTVYNTLTHGTLSNAFRFAYETKEVPPVTFGGIYVNGVSDFADTAVFENAISLPNTSYFSGNMSELNNDSGYLKSSTLNYLAIAGSLSVGSSTSLMGQVRVGTGNTSWFLGSISGQSNGAYLQNNTYSTASTSSFALYQDSNTVGSPATLINAPVNGYIGLQINNATKLLVNTNGFVGLNNSNPAFNLDVGGSIRSANDIYFNNSLLPASIINEVAGTTPVINLSVNFREATKNNTYLGAAFKVDTRNTTGNYLFQWLYRAAGTSTETNLTYIDNAGNLTTIGNITAFNTTSDRKLKKNVSALTDVGSIVDRLTPVSFVWKDDIYYKSKRGRDDIGLIAQDVAGVFPLAHGKKTVDQDVIETVDYLKLVPLLLAEIKSLRQRVAALEG